MGSCASHDDDDDDDTYLRSNCKGKAVPLEA
jgi:hypothetical protein